MRDRAEAEEVVQETFLEAWRRAEQYQPERANVAAWLLTITRSRAIDRLRSRGTSSWLISRGTDLIAMKIRDVAKEHNVPVLQSPMLARALYAHAELEQPIERLTRATEARGHRLRVAALAARRDPAAAAGGVPSLVRPLDR